MSPYFKIMRRQGRSSINRFLHVYGSKNSKNDDYYIQHSQAIAGSQENIKTSMDKNKRWEEKEIDGKKIMWSIGSRNHRFKNNALHLKSNPNDEQEKCIRRHINEVDQSNVIVFGGAKVNKTKKSLSFISQSVKQQCKKRLRNDNQEQIWDAQNDYNTIDYDDNYEEHMYEDKYETLTVCPSVKEEDVYKPRCLTLWIDQEFKRLDIKSDNKLLEQYVMIDMKKLDQEVTDEILEDYVMVDEHKDIKPRHFSKTVPTKPLVKEDK